PPPEPAPEPEPKAADEGEVERRDGGEREAAVPAASAAPESGSEDEIPPIVVTYQPKDIFKTGGSAQVLDDEELQRFEYDDAHDVLVKVPGVYVRTEDGFGLRPNVGI